MKRFADIVFWVATPLRLLLVALMWFVVSIVGLKVTINWKEVLLRGIDSGVRTE